MSSNSETQLALRLADKSQELADAYKDQAEAFRKMAESEAAHAQDTTERCKKEEQLWREKEALKDNHQKEMADKDQECDAKLRLFAAEQEKKVAEMDDKMDNEVCDLFNVLRCQIRQSTVANADLNHKKSELVSRAREYGINTSLGANEMRYQMFCMKQVDDMEKEYKMYVKKRRRVVESASAPPDASDATSGAIDPNAVVTEI